MLRLISLSSSGVSGCCERSLLGGERRDRGGRDDRDDLRGPRDEDDDWVLSFAAPFDLALRRDPPLTALNQPGSLAMLVTRAAFGPRL